MLDKKFLNNFRSINMNSQLGQDALAFTLFGDSGYFVEFGAADGFHLSNTYILENNYNWKGILSEPNIIYHESLKKRSCIVDTRCVYSTSGETVKFASVNSAPELSTISTYAYLDHWGSQRSNNLESLVVTVTLDDLLDQHSAPMDIEYISIDTEGSELDILSQFSFTRNVKLFTIEHNYTNNRDKIYELMTSKGYTRILEQFSHWDDWYIK